MTENNCSEDQNTNTKQCEKIKLYHTFINYNKFIELINKLTNYSLNHNFPGSVFGCLWIFRSTMSCMTLLASYKINIQKLRM